METIKLPEIPVPPGCEAHDAKLLRGIKKICTFASEPEVVPNESMRSMTAALEHSLESGATQADVLASAAKRKKQQA